MSTSDCIITTMALCALASMIIFDRKGWGALPGILLGGLLGPIGLLIVVAVPANENVLVERRIARGELARCNFCQEPIQLGAVVCPHCRREHP